MNDSDLIRIIASIVAQSVPLMLAVIGETLTERVGVINLSLDGTMLFSAMAAFVVALQAQAIFGIPGDTLPVLAGILVAALSGALVSLLIAWGSYVLKKDQVAIGFVLTLLLADMANFLGQTFTHIPGPSVKHLPIPFLESLPVIGPVLFQHDLFVYGILITVGLTWWWMYKTQPGLQMRGIGERPEAAFARGVRVGRLRYLYTAIGGAMVGVSGAAYSLDIKLGWSDNHILGIGWIALAIVIFGGWHPLRGAFGTILYGVTKALATVLQQSFPDVPVVLFNSLQWLLMLGVLLLVGSAQVKHLIDRAPEFLRGPLARALRVAPPQALGRVFVDEQ
jgi:general nucleoside transport system permease protein